MKNTVADIQACQSQESISKNKKVKECPLQLFLSEIKLFYIFLLQNTEQLFQQFQNWATED